MSLCRSPFGKAFIKTPGQYQYPSILRYDLRPLGWRLVPFVNVFSSREIMASSASLSCCSLGLVSVDDLDGDGEVKVVLLDEGEFEIMLISSKASLVQPKTSLWMRRCCVRLLLIG